MLINQAPSPALGALRECANSKNPKSWDYCMWYFKFCTIVFLLFSVYGDGDFDLSDCGDDGLLHAVRSPEAAAAPMSR